MKIIILWIIVAVLILIALFVVLGILISNKKRRDIDYYALFIIGIIWLPAGIAIGNSALWILGTVFMAIGLANKNKWKKNRRTWSNMSKEEKKLWIIVMVILGILVLVGLVFFILFERGIV